MNASTIIQDIIDSKNYFSVICKRSNISKIIDFAFGNSNSSSQNASLGVLISIVQLHNEKKNSKNASKSINHDDNDDEPTLQNSDDEDESQSFSASNLVEMITTNISKIVEGLSPNTETDMLETTYLEKVQPLGSYRLRLVELVFYLVKLSKPQILSALSRSEIFAKLTALMSFYPWNNFLQLRIIQIFEEVIKNSDHREFRTEVLTSSKIGEILVELGKKTMYTHKSERPIRHGYMATVIKIANMLKDAKD